MKGRSRYNRPEAKEGEVYKVLRKLPSGATWKELWEIWRTKNQRGKTTLSNTLYAMVKKGTIERIQLSRRRQGRGPHVQFRYILTEKGVEEHVHDAVREIEELLAIMQERSKKRTMPPNFESHILELALKTRDLSDAFKDFEKEYNWIKRKGELIVSSHAQEAKMSKQS